MKVKNKVVKFICCCNITLGARLIGFIGIVLSAGLASVLLHDKSNSNYNASRKMAYILGLDWEHFHSSANVTHEADPHGQMISVIMVFYSLLYMITSLCLIFSTIMRNRSLALPWLLCECLGCLSKIAALIFHKVYDTKQYNTNFVISSMIYIVVIVWWWLVVFAAQMTWKKDDMKPAFKSTSYFKAENSTLEPPAQITFKKNKEKTGKKDSMKDLSHTYIVSERYAQI